MTTEKQRAALLQYRLLMEEVKVRVLAIEHTANGFTQLNDQLAMEVCFLQLRMLCEVLALACLTAHGDLAKTQTVRDEYAPGKILSLLEGLHEYFYPCPIVHQTATSMHMVDATGPFLTKREVIELHGRCGDMLHKGSIQRLRAKESNAKPNFDDVVSAAQKFFDLLGNHNIVLFDDRVILCSLNAGPSGKVSVALAVPQHSE